VYNSSGLIKFKEKI